MTYKITAFFLTIILTISFWLYSRFTVDDAFISWIYAKNLIQHGILNYNPSLLDLTQSYTNPIFVVLSLIPIYFNFDIVLFFKLFSLTNLIIFCFYYLFQTKGSYLTLLLLLAIPSTIIHLFGGLETFFYVSLVSALYISLDKNNKKLSTIISLILFLTRPETWLFCILIPIFFLFKKKTLYFNKNFFYKKKSIIKQELQIRNFIIIALYLFVPLVIYLLLNKFYYGYMLPNSFYIKSNFNFSLSKFFELLFFITPVLLIVLFGRIKIFFLILTYSLMLAINYSMSNLMMNYSSRFTFQIFIPIFIFLIYLSMQNHNFFKINLNKKIQNKISLKNFTKFTSIIFLIFYLQNSSMTGGLITYYPRALNAHALLGKTLSGMQKENNYNIRTIALGDAGMIAYYSDLLVLDFVGLGSSLVAHKNPTNEILNIYKPDLIIFYSHDNQNPTNEYDQDKILNWATQNGLSYTCDVYFLPSYRLTLYSRSKPQELLEVCKSSQLKNNKTSWNYLQKIWHLPPWSYWTE